MNISFKVLVLGIAFFVCCGQDLHSSEEGKKEVQRKTEEEPRYYLLEDFENIAARERRFQKEGLEFEVGDKERLESLNNPHEVLVYLRARKEAEQTRKKRLAEIEKESK